MAAIFSNTVFVCSPGFTLTRWFGLWVSNEVTVKELAGMYDLVRGSLPGSRQDYEQSAAPQPLH